MTYDEDEDFDGLNHGPVDMVTAMSNARSKGDRVRILRAQLIGSGYRTGDWDARKALDDLGEVATMDGMDAETRARACVDAAEHWERRAAADLSVIPSRARRAAKNLRQLGRDIAGRDVEPSPRENKVTYDIEYDRTHRP